MKTKSPPVPELGTIGWLVFDPQAGREKAGRRHAIVLNHTRYNEKTGLAVICPITSKVKGYPFELAVPASLPVGGVVLCDHVRSQGWNERKWEPICKAPLSFVHEVMARTMTLFDVPGSWQHAASPKQRDPIICATIPNHFRKEIFAVWTGPSLTVAQSRAADRWLEHERSQADQCGQTLEETWW